VLILDTNLGNLRLNWIWVPHSGGNKDNYIEVYRRFGGTYCLHVQGRRLSKQVVVSAHVFLVDNLAFFRTLRTEAARPRRNVCEFVKDCTASYPCLICEAVDIQSVAMHTELFPLVINNNNNNNNNNNKKQLYTFSS
jgi:hypothetical protein